MGLAVFSKMMDYFKKRHAVRDASIFVTGYLPVPLLHAGPGLGLDSYRATGKHADAFPARVIAVTPTLTGFRNRRDVVVENQTGNWHRRQVGSPEFPGSLSQVGGVHVVTDGYVDAITSAAQNPEVRTALRLRFAVAEVVGHGEHQDDAADVEESLQHWSPPGNLLARKCVSK